MVEYTVILLALTAALIAPALWKSSGEGEVGAIGLDQSQRGTLLRAIANKHRGYGYALSLAEIPEIDGAKWAGQPQDPLIELAAYYDSLGKYPALAPQLRNAGNKLGELGRQLEGLNQELSRYIPPKWDDICRQLAERATGGLPFAPPPPGC